MEAPNSQSPWGGSHIFVAPVRKLGIQEELLSLCAASWMWVRHRSVVIVPPEGALEFVASREIETTVFDPASQFLSNISRRA